MFQGEAGSKHFVAYSNPGGPYLLLLDTQGAVRWRGHGLFRQQDYADFASDILVGGALGYVTGTYFATHQQISVSSRVDLRIAELSVILTRKQLGHAVVWTQRSPTTRILRFRVNCKRVVRLNISLQPASLRMPRDSSHT
jgi:hypothetical protein